MRFFLFILANAMLFIRPSELLPELGDFELYRYVIFACLLVSVPVVLHQLFARSNGVPPIVGCVLGLFPAVLLSHLSHGNGEEALDQGIEFLKVLVYFLLLIGLVTTGARLRQLLLWLAMFSAALTAIAVLRYHAVTQAPEPPPTPEVSQEDRGKNKKTHTIAVKEQQRDPETGELVDIQRMCGTGIFNDPNDLALVLITAIPLCLYWLTDSRHKALRPLWIGLILLFGYALMLTHSRGGLLALVAGLTVLLQMRFGSAKTLLFGMLLLPMLLAVFAGRQTEISTSQGTGQTRIQLWCDGLMLFQQAPLFGIGMEAYQNVSYHVAHNSYIHCYAELGILGGTLFVGAFYFALDGLYRLRHRPAAAIDPREPYKKPAPVSVRPPADSELLRLHPYLMAMLVAYAAGIFFLSRSYIVPTYLLLGLAVIYLRLRSDGTAPAWCKLAMVRLSGVSVCFLVGAYTFVRLFVQWN
jgi:putative inorganic carbon (hco3(-)) transporter